MQAVFYVRAQVNAQRAAVAVEQDLEIAAGLGGFDRAESVFLVGNRQVARVVRSDLQKDAVVCAAFVGLSGRVQKARSEAQARCNRVFVQNRVPDFLQPRLIFLVHFDIGEQGEIIAFFNSRQMRG